MTDAETALDDKVREAMSRLAPTVAQAETVNIAASGKVPHPKWSMWLSAAIFSGFTGVTLIVLLNNYDGLTKGLIIGTWNSMAIGTFTFWLGSSSGGKSQGTTKP